MFSRDRSSGQKRLGSNFTYAIALACGTALLAGAVATPAEAQRSKKKKKKEKEQKPNYSPAFVAAYTPVEEKSKGLVPDVEGAKALIPAMLAAAATPDDKMAGGRILAVLGGSGKDTALQRQGYELMIESGKATPEELPRFLFNAGQLAYADDDYAVALMRIKAARDAGLMNDSIDHTIAGLYFLQDKHDEGFQYLDSVVGQSIAKGEKPLEKLLQQGFSAGYNNEMPMRALSWSKRHVEFYPSEPTWINVIALRRDYFFEEQPMILDLLRLQNTVADLKNNRDYLDYIEASSVRFPVEMDRIVKKGLSAGVLDSSSVIVQEAQDNIAARVTEVKEDMAGLEADARKPGASARIATAAADVLLSLEEHARAEEMYAIALARTGVDADMVNTRLGIAQTKQGKGAEAQASFAKAGGRYKHVAELWSVHAGTLAAPVAETTTTTAM